ncbi:hypothetical protein BAU15_13800 [Enterococcus sp. JM4C]|uniref:competence protein ComK n=1 Tax=Candidatus Enterococcus huntleyi TaxID=1857217 RepID=UPI001379C109|nr:competence protein ComK [Enterococcus sp. JM4C]KAF1298346.1 hypothetical protein BAU15_13800 [Enterococcus sp. JM4C]
MRNHYMFRKEHTTHPVTRQINPLFQKLLHAHSVHSIDSCRQFSRQLTLSPSEKYVDEIYALIPFESDSKELCTLIIYENYIRIVNQPPLGCVQFILLQTHFFSYITYCKAISNLLDTHIYKIPVATLNSVLIPLETPMRQNTTIWINPARVADIHLDGLTTYITFSNKFSITSPVQKRALQHSMSRSFVIWGIIHQEFVFPIKLLSQNSLANFLDIQMNPLLAVIFKKLTPTDYQYEKWAFSTSYRKIAYEERLKQYEETHNILLD